MSGTSNIFTRLSNLSHIPSVMIADGRSCYVSRERVVQASFQIRLDNVLYVSDFPVNLLSISAITTQLMCYVSFFLFHCTFQNLQTRKMIGLGRKRGDGMYLLVRDEIPCGLVAFMSTSELSVLWHYRLGHPSHQKLQQALPWISVSPFDCQPCQLGKHHRVTFRRLRLVSSQSLFDLVHCDVWGPSRVQSMSGHRHYIVFVYDYSRTSWVYLLKDQLHVMSVVKQFLAEIKNQFSITVKCLRIDNALEFVQKKFQTLCASLGIKHQTTCPQTSQQNGVAERKHRHILDVVRTIMLQMKVPKHFWSDAILTGSFLINRMPSTPLGGEIPLR